jgi:peroxiredoxin
MNKVAFITLLFSMMILKIQAQNWQLHQTVAAIENKDASKVPHKVLWVYLPSTSPKCTYSSMLLAAFNQYFSSGHALNQKIEVQVIVQDTTYYAFNKFRGKPFAEDIDIIYLRHSNRHLIQKYGLLTFDTLNSGAKVYFFDHQKVVYKNDNYTAVGHQLKPLEIAISKNLNTYKTIKKMPHKMLKVGDSAPSIFDEKGTLHDYSEANTIVSFYPAAFSGALAVNWEENSRTSAVAGKQFQSQYGIKPLNINYLDAKKTTYKPFQRASDLSLPIFRTDTNVLKMNNPKNALKPRIAPLGYEPRTHTQATDELAVNRTYSTALLQQGVARYIMCIDQPNLLSSYALVLDKSFAKYGGKTKVFAISNTTQPILDAWKEIEAMPSVHFLNDLDFKMAQQFNSLNNEGYCKRSIFIIDKKGVIRFADTDFEYDDEAKIQAVLAEISRNE